MIITSVTKPSEMERVLHSELEALGWILGVSLG